MGSSWIIGALVAGVLGISTLMGWSHKALKEQLREQEGMIASKLNRPEVRLVIEDQLMPYSVVSRQVENRLIDIEDKLDEILKIVYKG